MSLYAYFRLGPAHYSESYGLDFEDFAVGQQFLHRPGVTVSQQDNSDHALLTMNSAMLHFDVAYAGYTGWSRPLVVSTLIVQRVIGLCAKTFSRRKILPRFDEIELKAPVFGGDTLYATSMVLALDSAQDPDCGLVRVETRGVNASGVEVIRMRYLAEVYRRGRGPDADRGGAPAEEERFAAYDLVGGQYRERFGLYFDDCIPGETFLHHPRRSFFRDEAIQQAYKSMEGSAQYHDLEWARHHLGGLPRIPETFVPAAATTASTRTFGRVVANLGWYEIDLPTPVLDGDTVQAESEILCARESKSRPGQGVVSVATRALNQRGELVVSFRRTLLVYRRSADAPYERAGYG